MEQYHNRKPPKSKNHNKSQVYAARAEQLPAVNTQQASSVQPHENETKDTKTKKSDKWTQHRQGLTDTRSSSQTKE